MNMMAAHWVLITFHDSQAHSFVIFFLVSNSQIILVQPEMKIYMMEQSMLHTYFEGSECHKSHMEWKVYYSLVNKYLQQQYIFSKH
jgi:hypothetical protein